MNSVFQQFVSHIAVGKRQTYKNLTLFPVFAGDTSPLDYAVLDDALARESVEITEISDQGSVPELKIYNKDRKHVLIIDGEELLGAKQNRIVNASFLIPPAQEVVIPVSCVEQGRWKYTSNKFTTSKIIYTARARRQKCKSTTVSLRLKNSYATDQGEIWDTVNEYLTGNQTTSQTFAFNDYYRLREQEVENFVNLFKPAKNQVGNIVYINGDFVVFDSFTKAATMAQIYPKLMRSYALDAVDRNEEFNIFMPIEHTKPKPKVEKPKPGLLSRLFGNNPEELSLGDVPIDRTNDSVARTLQSVEVQSYSSVGEGDDLRFENKDIMGSALVYRDRIVHMNFFPN